MLIFTKAFTIVLLRSPLHQLLLIDLLVCS